MLEGERAGAVVGLCAAFALARGVEFEPGFDVRALGPTEEIEERLGSAFDGPGFEGLEEGCEGLKRFFFEEARDEGFIGGGEIGENCRFGDHAGKVQGGT